MYNIDINFLKDRKLDTSSATTTFKKKTAKPMGEKLPTLIGAGVAVAFIAAVGGSLLFLNNQKTSTNSTIAQLDQEIQRLQGQNSQIKQIETEIEAINREIGILVSVFNQIKPWSSMLTEIGTVTPPNVQIQGITQAENQTLTINGFAKSYDDVNDFLLTLKNSAFLNGEATNLTTTSIGPNPGSVATSRAQILGQETTGGATNDGVEITLPPVVLYTITTEITDKPAEELLNQLSRRGAIGLVSRITNLQRKGALKLQEVAATAQPEKPAEGEAKQ
ncbi:type IV pilus biogenesis protein PilN [Geminocystis sp. NIES-3708]|uniref:PilN domain-containing protein n=1 Tax=Geminocystis sp. NIES-3708 TaxID=1615909 RepID=UPI0005FC969D|nr:PilN domain-containing protein [Geminocystis sp. NIES-3708]BAQ59662.1 type IV pilus biogenesis protein PilN [Geminocystis sp. NIES-3708]